MIHPALSKLLSEQELLNAQRETETYRSSISKEFITAIPKLLIIAYGVGVFLTLLEPPFQIGKTLFQPLTVCVYFLMMYPIVLLRTGRSYIQISSDGFILHRGNPKFYATFLPWQALKRVKSSKSPSLELLCSKEGIASTSSVFMMDFSTGLVREYLPSPINKPEEFIDAVLKYAPADNPLAVFLRENPDYIFVWIWHSQILKKPLSLSGLVVSFLIIEA